MSTHTSKRWSKRKKALVLGIPAGALAFSGAAWAAVAIFGFGSFTSAASATNELTIVGTPSLSNSLVPGQSAGVKGVVRNTNDFPITVSSIIIKKDSTTVTGGTPAECQITLHERGTSATYPARGTAASVPGSTAFSVTPVTIPAGGDVLVTVPNVVKQAAAATKLCGVTADYAVVGAVGSDA